MINDFHVHMGKSSKGGNYTVQDLLHSMDKFGIECSGLSILNGVTVSELNEKVIAAVKEFPDRIVGYAYINPREKNAIDEVHKCLQIPGMVGVKFHSWKHGYFPDNNSAIDPIVAEIAKYDVPILCHTGTAPLSLPQQWAVIAQRHPDAIFVFAHIGYLDFGYGCVECARPLKNVYVDTAGQIEIPILEKAFDELGGDRIIFGTDWPYKYPGSELCKFEAIQFDEVTREKIFYSNAKKLWKKK